MFIASLTADRILAAAVYLLSRKGAGIKRGTAPISLLALPFLAEATVYFPSTPSQNDMVIALIILVSILIVAKIKQHLPKRKREQRVLF